MALKFNTRANFTCQHDFTHQSLTATSQQLIAVLASNNTEGKVSNVMTATQEGSKNTFIH